MLPDKYVITIGRSFGSGGRALGRMIAERLGIAFYDKMLLVKAAEKAGYNIEYFEQGDERVPRIMGSIIPFSMGFYPMSWVGDSTGGNTDRVYKAQCDFIHDLANGEPCVIVGRSADYVLRDVDNVVNIFVHAPIDECAKRIVGRHDTQTSRKLLQLLHRQTLGPRHKLRPVHRLLDHAPRKTRRLHNQLHPPPPRIILKYQYILWRIILGRVSKSSHSLMI